MASGDIKSLRVQVVATRFTWKLLRVTALKAKRLWWSERRAAQEATDQLQRCNWQVTWTICRPKVQSPLKIKSSLTRLTLPVSPANLDTSTGIPTISLGTPLTNTTTRLRSLTKVSNRQLHLMKSWKGKPGRSSWDSTLTVAQTIDHSVKAKRRSGSPPWAQSSSRKNSLRPRPCGSKNKRSFRRWGTSKRSFLSLGLEADRDLLILRS